MGKKGLTPLPAHRREWGLDTTVRIIDSSPHQALIAKGQSSKGLLRPQCGRAGSLLNAENPPATRTEGFPSFEKRRLPTLPQ